MLYEQASAILLANIAVGVVVVFVLLIRADSRPWALLAWGILLILVTGARMAWVRHVSMQLPNMIDTDDARYLFLRYLFALGTASSGLIWGALAWVAALQSDPFALLFVTFVVGGMVAGSLGSLGIDRLAYAGFAFFATIPVAIADFLSRGELGIGTGFLVLVFTATHFAYSRVVARNMRSSISLRFDNTELIEQLRYEKARADAERESKQRFLAAANHDMRQPVYALQLMQNYLDTMCTRGIAPDEKFIAQFAAKFRSPIASLSGLLDQLLEIAKLERNTEQNAAVTTSPVALNTLMQRVNILLAPKADSQQLQLRMVPSAIYINTNTAKFEQMLQNLVANALTYTMTGGVVVGVRRQTDGGISLAVYDTGVGILASDIERIFDDFTQVEGPIAATAATAATADSPPNTSRVKGFGLGLSIVRRVAATLGYTVSVKSIVGRGSCFSINIPANAISQPTQLAALDSLDTSQSNAHHGRSSLSQLTKPTINKRILIIEDDDDARHALNDCLTLWGYEVLAQANSETVMSRLTGTDDVDTNHTFLTVDAIICDYELGATADSVNGLTLITEWNRCRKLPPTLLVTGQTLLPMDVSLPKNASLTYKPVSQEKMRQFLESV